MSDTEVIDEPTISDRHDAVLAKLGIDDFDVSDVESDFTENAVQDEPPVALPSLSSPKPLTVPSGFNIKLWCNPPCI